MSEDTARSRPFQDFLTHLVGTEAFGSLMEAAGRPGAASASGLPGASAVLVAALLARKRGRPVLLVAPTDEEAGRAARDAGQVLDRVVPFRAWTTPPGDNPDHDRAVFAERCLAQAALAEPQALAVAASARALLTGVPPAAQVTAADLELAPGLVLDPDGLLGRLVDLGLEHAWQVEGPGQFARRGGILDIWPAAASRPVRVELLGDQVEGLRRFDPDTQRTLEPLDSVSLALPSAAAGDHGSLLEHLPAGVLPVFLSPHRLREKVHEGARLLAGRPDLLEPDRVLAVPAGRALLELSPHPDLTGGSIEFGLRPGHRVGGTVDRVMDGLERLAGEHRQVLLLCPLEAEDQRIREILAERGRDADKARLHRRVVLSGGDLSAGFTLLGTNGHDHGGHDDDPASGTLVLPAHELFDRYEVARKPGAAARGKFHAAPGRPIDSFLELEPGDLVVHLTHGIGRFVDVKLIEKGGRAQEFLVLEYKDEVQLYVPLARLDLVQKYVGAGGTEPSLSRLGGQEWEKRKEQVKRAVRDLAADLIEVQAARQTRPGIPCPPDSAWQHEFEAAFPYEETGDQLQAVEDVKADMEAARPMDRLVCGDVGYGKTEVAMRAAFKTVLAGRQAAVLVPTTVLAQQHHNTFRERMADFPVRIEMISRFRTAGEIREVLDRTGAGEVDILIGTHRLLSKDVQFKDLGLVVVDEEQRFGVGHKERLKRMRAVVDVLTLTATPIPRTLHMALLGLKDISSLTQAPSGRLSIESSVERYDEVLIRRYLLRELARGGQIYFVHNRVLDIGQVARRLMEIVPEARYAVVHGQMPADELEDHMDRFLHRQVDVLVTTTIIESGMDIPNVNTVIVNEADMFGLADLHQLRGRVGRSRHQAYALFLLPRDRPITHNAEPRLRAIEDYTELGAGFRIAMRDLEIRGAGNILGAEQSGHIAAVGYDLYCRLLAQAVEETKAGRAYELPEVDIDIDVAASIPEDYVEDLATKLSLYRSIAHAADEEHLDDVRAELRDRFGQPPGEVEALLEKARLRIRARAVGIATVGIHKGEVRITCRPGERERAQLALAGLGKPVRVLDERSLVVDYGGRTPFPEEVLVSFNAVLKSPRKLEAIRP